MPLKAVCPNPSCVRQYVIPESAAGRSTQCRACGQTFVIGGSETNIGSAPPAPAAPRHPPASQPEFQTVGRFLVRGKLGAGAFGTVYRAYDPNLNREVALKIPNPGAMDTPQRVERFLREAKAAANLRHPHIVPVFDAGQDGDHYYIASAFIDGKPLSDTIEERGTDFPRAARVVRELAEALAYAHEQGIVHRDVKPQNIMVDAHGHIHLMDFGLAARHDEEARLTADGAVMGTPAYMAPEQAAGQKGEAQPATDQYAAGVVLYELLTGQVPFSGPLPVVMHNVIHTDPDPPRKFRPFVPKDLETICLKAMSKQAGGRYADCAALAADLRRWQEGEPISARRMSLYERATRWVQKEPKLAGAMAVIALVVLVSVGLVLAAASRASAARQQAEGALADLDASRKREEQLVDDKFGAIGTTEQARKKLAEYDAKLNEAQASADALRKQIAEAQKKVEAVLNENENFSKKWTEAKATAESMKAKQAEDEQLRLRQPSESSARGRPELYSHVQRQVETLQETGAQNALDAVPYAQRGWEWYHLSRSNAKRPSSTTLALPGRASAAFVLSADADQIIGIDYGTSTVYRVNCVTKATASALSDRLDPLRKDEVVEQVINGLSCVYVLKYISDNKGTRQYRIEQVLYAHDVGKLILPSTQVRESYPMPSTLMFLQLHASKSNRDRCAMVTPNRIDFGKWDPRRDWPLESEMKGKLSTHFQFAGAGTFGPVPRPATYSFGPIFPEDSFKPTVSAMSKNDEYIYCSGKIVRLSDNSLQYVVSRQPTKPTAANFSPKGQCLAIAYEGQGTSLPRVRMYSFDRQHGPEELLEFWGHTGNVSAVAFSPDNGRLVSGSEDGTVKIWDTATRECLLTLSAPGPVLQLAVSADGRRIVAVGKTQLRIWESRPIRVDEIGGRIRFVLGIRWERIWSESGGID